MKIIYCDPDMHLDDEWAFHRLDCIKREIRKAKSQRFDKVEGIRYSIGSDGFVPMDDIGTKNPKTLLFGSHKGYWFRYRTWGTVTTFELEIRKQKTRKSK